MNRTRTARLVSLGIIAVIFAIMLAYADLRKVAQAFTGIRWRWAVWVPVLNLANTFVEGLRLSVILFPVTRKLHIRNGFNATLTGIIGNIMLPLRFGDGAKAYYVAKTEKISLSSSFSALMLDRIADFFFFFVLMALTAMLYPFPPSITKLGLIGGVLFAASIAVIFALAGISHKVCRNSAGKIRTRIAREVDHFMAGLSVMRKAGLLFPVLFLSVLSWVLRAAMIWFIFRAFRLPLPLIATPVTLILLNFGVAVVSTPANLGGFELATVGALKLFSVEIAVGLSCALALHVIEVAPMLAFGIIWLWFEGFKTKDVLQTARDAQMRPPEESERRETTL